MTQTTIEAALRDVLPAGWKTTFRDEDKLRQLSQVQNYQSELSETVVEYQGNVITEEDVIEEAIERPLSGFLLPERTLELPGLGLVTDGQDLIKKFAAKYKRDNATPSGTIKDPGRAGTDDIVFTLATPEVFNEINDNGGQTSNFKQPGLSGGDVLNLVGEGGIDETVNSTGASLQLDDDEYLFFTGDFVDLEGGQMVVTATQFKDIDGEEGDIVRSPVASRLSGAHLTVGEGAYVTSTVDIDAKVYADGDAEILPVAFYMADGQKAPDLV
jgi:hypothetical protein